MIILDPSISKKDFFEFLVERIKSQSLNLFLGAGISKNPPSNLPLSKEFRKFVFEELCTNEGITEIYEKHVEDLANIPFESFVGELLTGSNFFDFFLSVFGSGKPNKNHFLIAQLIEKGFITEILTTNFDMKLEEAVESYTKGSSRLDVLFEEKQFQQIMWETVEKPVICKIHGGIQAPSSIRTTLDLISRQSLKQDRLAILEYFFKKSGKDILILGYSCSDDFDINPFLKNLQSKINVLIVKHSPKDFRIESLRGPFNAFSGNQVVCNTDKIINYLWSKFSRVEYQDLNKNNERDWRNEIHKWNKGLNSAQRCYLLGNVLLEMREPDESIDLYNRGLKRKPDRHLNALLLTRLATAQNLKGHYEKAAQTYKESLPLLEEGKDDVKIAEVYHFLGMLEKLRGNYPVSENYLRKSKEIAEKIGYRLGIAIVTAELGTLAQRRGDFPEAKELYETALTLSRKIGHLVGIAVCSHQLGTIARIEKDVKRAEELFTEELELRKKLGDKQGVAGSKHELGLCARIEGRLDMAQELLEEALEILGELGDNARIAWTLNDLGTVYYARGDLEGAEDLTQQSIRIKKQKRDQRGLAVSLGQLALIRMGQSRDEEAKSLLNETYKIARNLGDKYLMELAAKNLKVLHSKRS